jgi:hypothetical protein
MLLLGGSTLSVGSPSVTRTPSGPDVAHPERRARIRLKNVGFILVSATKRLTSDSTGLDIHPNPGDIRTVQAVGWERLAHGLGACHAGAG